MMLTTMATAAMDEAREMWEYGESYSPYLYDWALFIVYGADAI